MATISADKIWKVFTVVLGVVVMPLAGWVWNTNLMVHQITNDLGDAEDTIESLEVKIS